MSDLFDLVKADLDERNRIGHKTYGGPMVAHDGRKTLLDSYEEALDQVVYLKKALIERDSVLAVISEWPHNTKVGSYGQQCEDWCRKCQIMRII